MDDVGGKKTRLFSENIHMAELTKWMNLGGNVFHPYFLVELWVPTGDFTGLSSGIPGVIKSINMFVLNGRREPQKKTYDLI